jgi:hypothetical protein
VAHPKKHWPMVEASRDEASHAVRLYNDATDIRSFESFVVQMHLAWLYLLHAWSTRDKIVYRYWQRDNPRRLERITASRTVGARPQRARALAGPEKPGARKPRLLYPVRTRSLAL